METPVTYFYTDLARKVNVRVSFPQGLLTEFFPPVETMQPEFNWKAKERIGKSSLDWGSVWIIPENRLRAMVSDSALADRLQSTMVQRLMPETSADDHYTQERGR